MLTSKLEDLIWKGKAFPKTFCVGGTQKHVLNIQPDRFIIITDLLYFPHISINQEESSEPYIDFRDINKWISINHISTQLTILGEKNFNRFQFRNNINFLQSPDDARLFLGIPATPTSLDTYLIHTTGVSFTFSFGTPLTPTDGGTLPDSTAFSNPVDYGKLGDLVVDNTTQINDVSTGITQFFNYVSREAGYNGIDATTNELAYPVDNDTNINSNYRKFGNSHPIVQVSYVEILGSPNNIGL
jgi:hypothetical protein